MTEEIPENNPKILKVRGAKQNNLKNLNLDIPLDEFIVVTGVSGSGKSSLTFDTIFAEGQRRYIQTFSPYARQFLDRMDRPKVESIDGVPPAVAINQVNPVRTTRSTVGTMTEINDHLKLLFSRAAKLYCPACGDHIKHHNATEIYHLIIDEFGSDLPSGKKMIQVLFQVETPQNLSHEFIQEHLERQGYTKTVGNFDETLYAVQDRTIARKSNQSRLIEAIEVALEKGKSRVFVQELNKDRVGIGDIQEFSTQLRCSKCKISFSNPAPNSFSFNSPIGACDTCRGFGQTMGIDYDLVIPNPNLSLEQGAIKLFNSKSYNMNLMDLIDYAYVYGVPVDEPWCDMREEDKEWVINGGGGWYGIKGVFDWLEGRKHKMHVRVILSRYRSYLRCTTCAGSRLKAEALNWRIGERQDRISDQTLFRHPSLTVSEDKFIEFPGYSVHDLVSMPLDCCFEFFNSLSLDNLSDGATKLVLDEIRSRLNFLVGVGLGYLNLDRQSRTLSGGEVQRINLTTALGSTLTNTLFVLDEPTIGLHAADIGRVIEILRRLRNNGNSLVVVEHDEQMMHAADRVLELGPEAGEKGGSVVHFGSMEKLQELSDSATSKGIKQRQSLVRQPEQAWKNRKYGQEKESNPIFGSSDFLQSSTAQPLEITIKNARQNNLKNLDISIPLNRLVCITGVSGSGKSTLIENVLYRGILRKRGKSTELPGAHDEITGTQSFGDVILVDQSAIGKSTRSNPASYIGVLNFIRDLLAQQPLAIQRNYTKSHFSFNMKVGRCPSCKGTGFEHIEMQFLSDVYLRCSDCNGTRFQAEVCEVKLPPAAGSRMKQARSIAEIFELTVHDAIEFFGANSTIAKRLRPLVSIGLEYLQLGQPVPTLSGGEAQRLKLASHLVESRSFLKSYAKLFILDEPTTGLHSSDVRKLIVALEQLLKNRHSVIVIEHNLDLISAADWIIDLGPGGGEQGGRLIAQGNAVDVATQMTTPTGKALNEYFATAYYANNVTNTLDSLRRIKNTHAVPHINHNQILLQNAREHNLKNVNLSIPYESITVVTGVSGSGKSTVAFDILFAEGQRRYLETVNAYARQFVQPANRADFDSVSGLPPTVAIEQRLSRGGQRSTVATITEIYHYLRLLFVRFGVQWCPNCNVEIHSLSVDAVARQIQQKYKGRKITALASVVVARKGYHRKIAESANKLGIQYLLVDGKFLPTAAWPLLSRFQEHDIDMPIATIKVHEDNFKELIDVIAKARDFSNGRIGIAECTPKINRIQDQLDSYSIERSCPKCHRSFADLDPRMFSYNSKHGWCKSCSGTGLMGVNPSDLDILEEDLEEHQTCGSCNGNRLNSDSLAVRFKGFTIDQFTNLPIDQAYSRFVELDLTAREKIAIGEVVQEIIYRLDFLRAVGLSYLVLNRSAPTLSGGEAQRIRLASQLGSGLCGAFYILDEPTIGLHRRDNQRLLSALSKLKELGNTVLIVEHDEETISAADYIIDLGPGGGSRGGEVVATGTIKEIIKNPLSITGRTLREPIQHPLPRTRSNSDFSKTLRIIGAKHHNLTNVDAIIPLEKLVCVTGVSGSGKSTLIRDVLYRNLTKAITKSRKKRGSVRWERCSKILGWKKCDRVLQVDQSPIGKTPRSCPATYVNVWQKIRNLFAETTEARLRGYTASRFSYNVESGRCSECKGQGEKKIEMNFLPDVQVRCEVCNGSRFNGETLDVRYRAKSISDVLNMNMEEAAEFFSSFTSLQRVFNLLVDVGLGYLTLGQPSPTLSGGEAQRIKLVSELSKALPNHAGKRNPKSKKTVYLLDEPTVGLHTADVEQLIRVIHALVDAGNTVVIIEHNLDVIAEADWVIDMGPEGGDAGGNIVFQGRQEKILKCENSYTASALRQHLGNN